MTVQELKEKLSLLPDSAFIMIKHDLTGCEHEAVKIEYDNNSHLYSDFGIVWIRETD